MKFVSIFALSRGIIGVTIETLLRYLALQIIAIDVETKPPLWN